MRDGVSVLLTRFAAFSGAAEFLVSANGTPLFGGAISEDFLAGEVLPGVAT